MMNLGSTALRMGLLFGLSAVAVSEQVAAPAGASTAKLPVYEVVSVKVNKSGSGNMSWNSTPNGVRMENVTLLMMVRSADYALRHAADDRITGLPGWAGKEHFDLEAKVSEEDAPVFAKLDEEQRSAMFRSLMEDRFKLKAHAETRDLPIYALVVAKGGVTMTPTKAADLKNEHYGSWGTNSNGNVMTADFKGGDAQMLADTLTQQLGRTVVDKTGLATKYDFKLEWTSEEATDAAASTVPGLFTAIQQQLGLRLDSQKGPVEGLVVDHVEEPSAN